MAAAFSGENQALERFCHRSFPCLSRTMWKRVRGGGSSYLVSSKTWPINQMSSWRVWTPIRSQKLINSRSSWNVFWLTPGASFHSGSVLSDWTYLGFGLHRCSSRKKVFAIGIKGSLRVEIGKLRKFGDVKKNVATRTTWNQPSSHQAKPQFEEVFIIRITHGTECDVTSDRSHCSCGFFWSKRSVRGSMVHRSQPRSCW